MKEELTTLMHAEFFDDPQEKLEILVMGAAARIRKGETIDKILEEYGLTKDVYNITLKKIFPNGLPPKRN